MHLISRGMFLSYFASSFQLQLQLTKALPTCQCHLIIQRFYRVSFAEVNESHDQLVRDGSRTPSTARWPAAGRDSCRWVAIKSENRGRR